MNTMISSFWIISSFSLCAMKSEGKYEGIITTQVTHDEIGNKKYVEEYPVKNACGLVEVRSLILNEIKPADLSITLRRHDKQLITVAAMLKKELVAVYDRSEQDGDDYKKYQWVWKPWRDNAIVLDGSQCSTLGSLRGGNRLEIRINAPGEYEVTIPSDADVKIKTKIGNIIYTTWSILTKLKLRIDVDNGSSGSERKKWDYDYGGRFSPKTELKTKKGYINVPKQF